MGINAAKAPEKFLFDTSFEQEQEKTVKKAVEAPPEPAYFDRDLDQARAEGMAAGKESGRQEALQSQEGAAAKALTEIGQHLPALQEAVADMQARQDRAAVDVAVAIVRKFLPRMARDDGLQKIETVVRDAMTRLRDEPRIVIRVCDSLLDTIEKRVAIIAKKTGFEGKIVFLSDESMGPGDVRVEWADGGAERDTARIWQDIDGAIRRLMSSPPESKDDATPPAPEQELESKRDNSN